MDLNKTIVGAGLPAGTPVAVAAVDRSGTIIHAASGTWPSGRAVAGTDRFYAANLAKQVTGAAAAVLVRDGSLDPDAPLSTYLHDLPGWSDQISARQIAHHLAGLPEAGRLEAIVPCDWTADFVHYALSALSELPSRPGSAYRYSNVGYVLLAKLLETVSGKPFSRFVRARLCRPLGIVGMGFSTECYEQTALLGPKLPLTFGDGGLWSTAPAFARWLQQQNRDALGIEALVTAPGRLSDGSAVEYGWGLGLRRFRGERLLIHGGEWPGAVAKAVRCPALGLAVVGMAAGGRIEQVGAMVDGLLEELASA